MNLNLTRLTKDKFFLFYIAISVVLIGILFFTFYLATRGLVSNKNIQATPSISPSVETNPEIVTIELDKVIPDEPSGLTSGLPHSFYVYFKKPITLDHVAFTVRYTYFYKDDHLLKPVQIETKLLGQNTVELRTVTPILEGAEYHVQVKDKKTNAIISTTKYSSLDIRPTPIKNNNLLLIPHLPYKTDSFVLEYLHERNIYIFHFIYNSNSPYNLQEQYENAKVEAIRFMESKGINPSTIIIEWRYS